MNTANCDVTTFVYVASYLYANKLGQSAICDSMKAWEKHRNLILRELIACGGFRAVARCVCSWVAAGV